VSEHAICHSGLPPKWAGTLLSENRGNAETLPDFMYFDLYPDATEADLADALRIQQRRFAGAAADASVLEREKPLALAEVTHLEKARTGSRDHLGKFAWSAFRQIAFHGASEVPFRERTAAITTQDVERFRAANFKTSMAMLTIVGDLDPAAVRRLIPDPWLTGRPAPPPAPFAIKHGSLKGSWDVTSHQFFMAWPVVEPSQAAHPALTVLSQLLSMRLASATNVRNLARGPAHVHADAGGFFVIQLALRSPDGGDAVAAEIRSVLDATATGEIRDRTLKNLQTAVRMLAAIGVDVGYPNHLRRKVMVHGNHELSRMRATLTWDQRPEDYCARADRVTAEDVKTAIKQYLAPEKATIVTIAGKE
jgi:predicted Zn-dependent peptidase